MQLSAQEILDFYEATFNEAGGKWHGKGLSAELINGELVLSYYALGETEYEVRVAKWDPTNLAWQVEKVASFATTQFFPSSFETSLIVVNNAIHVFYNDFDSSIKHAYKVDNLWQNEVIETPTGRPLYLDSIWHNSKFNLCFQSESLKTLYLAEGLPGNWQLTELAPANSGLGRHCDIAKKSDGELAIVAYNPVLGVPQFTEEHNGTWLPVIALEEPGSYKKGLTPRFLTRANGTEGIVYQNQNLTPPMDGSAVVTWRSAVGSPWQAAEGLQLGSYSGGWPVLLERQNGLLIAVGRRSMLSALFGKSGSTVMFAEQNDAPSIAGRRIAGRCSGEPAYYSNMNLLENENGSLFVAFYDPSCSPSNKGRIVLASNVKNGDAAPGVGPGEITVRVKNQDLATPLPGALVQVKIGEAGQEKVYQLTTPEDGIVHFEIKENGAFTIHTFLNEDMRFPLKRGTLSPAYRAWAYTVIGEPRSSIPYCTFDTNTCEASTPEEQSQLFSIENSFELACCYFPDGETLCCS